jgi:predicted PurR-regulated permease PerM
MLNTGRYNLIIFIICFILLYYIYNYIIKCNNNIEKMTNASDSQINDAVKKYLVNSDEFIKNITNSANQIQRNGLQINGNLNVSGSIKTTGDISNNQNSLSGMNNRINQK